MVLSSFSSGLFREKKWMVVIGNVSCGAGDY